ncbi:hypothetical protein [Acinetobacter lwoffii]|uniref:hypothetical protein n=1 Tax=Acinetobacter lwoffii TaxID=28090 RepID=UPI001E36B705|nr:hypothetical protein [Acinetobacter lwoffii]
MDILEEKEAFLNVYVNYKGDSRKIQFNEETEQFMWRKNNVSDTEVEYVHLMNQRWYAWLACAKSKAQAVPEGFVVVSQKDLLELTIAINAVDLATHTESKTNEVREMWQQVALKLMALGISQEPAND